MTDACTWTRHKVKYTVFGRLMLAITQSPKALYWKTDCGFQLDGHGMEDAKTRINYCPFCRRDLVLKEEQK